MALHRLLLQLKNLWERNVITCEEHDENRLPSLLCERRATVDCRVTQSLVDTACAPRHSGTGAVFSENFVSFKPGHGIHREVAPDLLKQKTKTHILKDEQELGTAVLCNESNWESEVGCAQ